MSDIAIRVDGLGKRYQIGVAQERHDTLRDAVMAGLKKPLGWLHRNGPQPDESVIWALKDVSFEVKQGEVVGIIGRNGAGKSTLLKILSRITRPTEGYADVYGRVGSLLEVGTGFHPELTGRENIYLNGAILGMARKEIERKFDEIVDFAEIEKFIDTPVKRYSSGMYVRLAFAVAAHMEPEILVVDEVLAVGDIAFQKKCLGKMEDVAQRGRTVLFVSHNMAAIEHLCTRGIMLEYGEVALDSTVSNVVAQYQNKMLSVDSKKKGSLPVHVLYEYPRDKMVPDFEIIRIELLDMTDQPKYPIYTWDSVKFRIHYSANQSITSGSVAFQISTLQSVSLLLLSTQPDSTVPLRIEVGCNFVDCEVKQLPLSAGEYVIGCGLAVPNKEMLCWHDNLAILSIMARDVYQSGFSPRAPRSLLAIPHTWRLPHNSSDLKKVQI